MKKPKNPMAHPTAAGSFKSHSDPARHRTTVLEAQRGFKGARTPADMLRGHTRMRAVRQAHD